MLSPYTVLGLPTSATMEEVKKKYRELCKKYHPDVCEDEDAEEHFAAINEAYEEICERDHSSVRVDDTPAYQGTHTTAGWGSPFIDSDAINKMWEDMQRQHGPRPCPHCGGTGFVNF